LTTIAMLTADRLLPLRAAASAASSLARLPWLNASEPLSEGALLAGVLLAAALVAAGALLAGAVEVDDELELEQAAARESAATAGMAASALRLILIAIALLG
jgi:hypothetical protein